MNDSYDDMIYLPHHVSSTHPHMSLSDRAAQFSPFAALTGYEEIIAETARTTEDSVELDEMEIEELDLKLQVLAKHVLNPPTVTITYFQPDVQKEGGIYRTITCSIKKIDPQAQLIRTTDGTEIPIPNLRAIEGSCFGL